MQRVRELEAWSRPGQLLSSEYGKLLEQDVWAAGVPREVFLGLSAIPDETDSESLLLSINAGELSEDAFFQFCKTNGLAENPSVAQSAAKFLEYSLGRRLAWIHLPEGGDPRLLVRVVDLMKARNHLVVDPQTMLPVE